MWVCVSYPFSIQIWSGIIKNFSPVGFLSADDILIRLKYHLDDDSFILIGLE